jgi:hypothetical protein
MKIPAVESPAIGMLTHPEPRDLAAQKCPDLLQELAEGRLGLEEQVIAARQSYESSARDAGRHAAPGLEGDAGLIPCVS